MADPEAKTPIGANLFVPVPPPPPSPPTHTDTSMQCMKTTWANLLIEGLQLLFWYTFGFLDEYLWFGNDGFAFLSI